MSGGQTLRFASTKRLGGKVRFAFRFGRLTFRRAWNILELCLFGISHWEADIQVWLEVCFLEISHWEADVQVWLEIRFVASRCGSSRCSAVPIFVHPVGNPQIWMFRHAPGHMDLPAGSQMWTPETWILHIASTDKGAEV